MEWLLELMERPLNKNFKTSFQFVKVAIWVSFASVLYEAGNGKYYLVDLSNVKHVQHYFDSGQIWTCFIYLIYAIGVYYITFGILAAIVYLIGVFFGNRLLGKENDNLTDFDDPELLPNKEFKNILSTYFGVTVTSYKDTLAQIDKRSRKMESAEVSASFSKHICTCLIHLKVIASVKMFTTPLFWNYVFVIGLVSTLIYPIIIDAFLIAGKKSIKIVKKILYQKFTTDESFFQNDELAET